MSPANLVICLLWVNFMIGPATSACSDAQITSCALPNCLCPSRKPPKGMQPKEVPQMVFLAFEGALNTSDRALFDELLFPIKNPNGIPISATFFINHQGNDYSLTHDLYSKGHEIALYTMSGSNGNFKDDAIWESEIVGQREQIASFAKVDKSELKGLQLPNTVPSEPDAYLKILKEQGFAYELTESVDDRAQYARLWPYTADSGIEASGCFNCAKSTYPGLWIARPVDFAGPDGSTCQASICVSTLMENTATVLEDNFLKQYNGDRAPFILILETSWFSNENDPSQTRKNGVKDFLNAIINKPDVWMLSISEGLEWMKNPVPGSGAADLWKGKSGFTNTCSETFNCKFAPEETPPSINSEQSMVSCMPCPKYYPWVNNPLGLNSYKSN